MIKIYENTSANAIFIENENGAQFYNSIQALQLDPASTKVSIYDNVKELYLVYEEEFSEFVDENGAQWGADATATTNALNTIFTNSGTPTGDAPTITSSLTIDMVEGSTLNYELTATYGVGYEWDLSAVSGVTTVEGNIRKLIGGSSLAVGSYSIPVKAINYNGEDSQTITLNVSTPPFSNTKSIQFNNNNWLGANAAILDPVLGRSSNGSGASDAWSIAFWFKAGTSNNQNQTVFYFGSNDINNGNHILIVYNGDNVARRQLNFRYGSNNNYLVFKAPVGSVASANGWQHIMYTYDGGTTGSSSGSVNAYYSRFKMFINGVQQTTINSNGNFGNTTGLSGQNLRVGRYNSGNYMRNNCKVDELNFWDSDQTANISDIYNGGVVFDTMTLTDQPVHRYRMGDNDTFSTLQDTGTAANCPFIMYGMTAANIQNDVP